MRLIYLLHTSSANNIKQLLLEYMLVFTVENNTFLVAPCSEFTFKTQQYSSARSRSTLIKKATNIEQYSCYYNAIIITPGLLHSSCIAPRENVLCSQVIVCIDKFTADEYKGK